MSNISNAIQNPLFIGFSAYLCAHVMLFSLVGMLGLRLPALWWSSLALLPSWLLFRWLKRLECSDLAQLVAIQAFALWGAVIGRHWRELFCLVQALV